MILLFKHFSLWPGYLIGHPQQYAVRGSYGMEIQGPDRCQPRSPWSTEIPDYVVFRGPPWPMLQKVL